MSGRKQHYIPQFILRSFGERVSGKKVQIRASTRTKTFISPTDGVAAQREFYSKIDDNPGRLDDIITYAESEYSEIFNDIVRAPAGSFSECNAAARLLTHLAVRGNYMRDAVSTFGLLASNKIRVAMAEPQFYRNALGLDGAEPSQFLRNKLDEMYNKDRRKYSKAKVSRFDFRRAGFKLVKENWKELYQEGLSSAQSLIDAINFPMMVEEAHNSVLSRSVEPPERVDMLVGLDWEIKDLAHPRLALPDCVAIANYPDVGPMPLGFVGKNDLQGVFFPISPTRAICGGVYRNDLIIDEIVGKFDLISAITSWEFVVTPPSYAADWVPRDRIGDSIINTMYDSMRQSAVGDLLNEML